MIKKIVRRKDVLYLIPLVAIFAAAMFVFTTESVSAETIADGECGDDAVWVLDDEGVLTISGTGATYDYPDIPWRDYSDSIQEINVDNGITTIGSHFFEGCAAEEINLPESLEIIKDRAFVDCPRISGITIPRNVINIGSRMFVNCSNLQYIELQCPAWGLQLYRDSIYYEVIIYYPENDLLYDSALMEWYAPDATWIPRGTVDVVTIGEGDCGENLTWKLNNVGILTIDGTGEMSQFPNYEAPWYQYRNNVREIILPEGITSICNNAFHNVSAKEITIPGSVTKIEANAFSGCALERVVLQEGVTVIGSSMFRNCTKLKDITIPETVESIKANAFLNCSSLETITIPRKVTSIASGVFTDCSSLKTIHLECSAPAYITNALSEFTGTVYYPGNDEFWDEETRSAWASDATWIPEGEISVDIVDEGQCGDNATWKLNNQGVLTISGTGKTDDYRNKPNQEPPWDEYRNSIRKIVVEEGITRIGSYFWSSGSASGSQSPLKKIEISDTVSEIGEQAFFGAGDVTEVTLPDGLKKIESNAFSWAGLEEVVIPGTFEAGYKGFSAFSYCRQLSRVKFEKGVTEIDDSLFRGCDNLQTIELPDSLTTIRYGAFAQCTSLKVLMIPQNVSYIGRFAFSECDDLETIVFKGAPPLNLESGAETAFESFAGTVYYPADDSKWNEMTRNDWASDATWKDSNTVVYDAAGDTTIVGEGTGTETTISDDEVQTVIEEIQLVKPKHVVVNAKLKDGTSNVVNSKTQIPASIVRAASAVGATFAVDTVVGKVTLDKASVDGAISTDTDSIELNITDKSDKSDTLTVVHDVELKVKNGSAINSVIDLAGIAEITVPTPPGTLESDLITSSYIGESAIAFVSDDSLVASTNNIVKATSLNAKSGEEQLVTTRTKKTVTSKTRKLGSIKATSDDFRNARVKASNLVYTGKALPAKNVKVTIGKKVLTSQDYKYTCSNNTKVGTAKIHVTGKRKYSGKTKTGSFYINPKKAVVSKVKVGKKKITVKIKTKPSATGGSKYRVEYRVAGTSKWSYKTTSSKSVTIKKLKKGKKYQIRVRAFRGARVGAYSAIKNTKKVK